MPQSQFSEDEFEQNLLFELREVYGPGLPHFKPSRVLENNIGYDFGVATWHPALRERGGLYVDDPRFRVMLPIQRRALLRHRYVTALIQCKVPFYVTKRKPPHVDAFDYWGGPYYRFEIDQSQANRLRATQQAAGKRACVRYATPCFHLETDSEAYVIMGLITQFTHFAAPITLVGHQHYTYRHPIQVGRAFSDPEDVEPAPLVRDIVDALQDDQVETLAEHALNLWVAFVHAADETRFDIQREKQLSLELASRAVGPIGRLPLDPFGVLRQRSEFSWPDGTFEPTILSFAAVIVGLERFARRFANCRIRIFHSAWN